MEEKIHGNAQAANMSLAEEKHEWSAARVRQTFLDYFKERGHTFGRVQVLFRSVQHLLPYSVGSQPILKDAN